MKIKYLYGIVASSMLMIGASSCSDNYNSQLEPVETETTLSAQINNEDLKKLQFSAEPQDTTITVISNTRWTVEVSDGGWCSVNVVSGRGNGEIILSVLEDMIRDRNCEVVFYKLNSKGEKLNEGKWTVTVSQLSSDVKMSPASVEPFAAQPIKGQEFQITSNVAWTLSIDYGKEDVKFITIQPISGMTEMADGNFTGTGNASFSVSLQNNGTAAVRNATLELKSTAGSYSVEIVQQKSEYTFDVSPNSTQYVDPEGDKIEFNVLSLTGWSVTTAGSAWITFSESGMSEGSTERIPIKAFVAPNTTGRLRRTTILFTPDKQEYVPMEVEVVQNGVDLAFSTSLANGEDPITAAGGVLTYSLDSRFDWNISAPAWVKPVPSEGKASNGRQTVELEVGVNNSYSSRSDSIYISPIATEFKGVGILEPSKVGVYPIRLFIQQDGGKKAAISIPWIGEVYENNRVSIDYNFYSPYYDVEVAGIKWKKADAQEWENELTLKPSDPKSATVSFLLEGLRNLTTYVAQGYIKCSNGDTIEGHICEPFTTAGNYPALDDNPAPEK